MSVPTRIQGAITDFGAAMVSISKDNAATPILETFYEYVAARTAFEDIIAQELEYAREEGRQEVRDSAAEVMTL